MNKAHLKVIGLFALLLWFGIAWLRLGCCGLLGWLITFWAGYTIGLAWQDDIPKKGCW